MITFVGGLVLGALALVALEALALFLLLNRWIRKHRSLNPHPSDSSPSPDLDPQQSLHFSFYKQGVVWFLAPENLPKDWQVDKGARELRRKKEFFEVSPIRRLAKIKDQELILTNSDASSVKICLKGCIVETVSATALPSRKWAKKFPLKIESKTSAIHNSSNIVYLYLETSWEKESWCKALRLASCEDKEKLQWFTKLNAEFHSYVASLNMGYRSFMKPSVGFVAETIDKGNRFDGSSSRVRLLWRKIARRAQKAYAENKGNWTSPSLLDERKVYERVRSFQDSTASNVPNSLTNESMASLSSAPVPRVGSQSHVSVTSDVDSEDKFHVDEGTLCVNLLISRLFFDAKRNEVLKTAIQERLQRTLSNLRTPSYIGEVICTDIDIGNLPPYIHSMRLLPMDMNEVWAFEVDIEYSGGALLNIETRLEACELDLLKGTMDKNSEASSVENVSSELLEGFEYVQKQLSVTEGTAGVAERKDEVDPKDDDSKSSTSTTTSTSRWKSILNSITKQVSQVPFSLSLRVGYLRGTLRLHIKPPPSDQIWFGFTSMPDIEFDLESSVGEHKISSGHIALFLISRFKASIRETMVLPNCETVCIPGMLAEKDDWVPRKIAPFIWLNGEAVSDYSNADEASGSQTNGARTKESDKVTLSSHEESKHWKPKNIESFKHSSGPTVQVVRSSESLHDLRTPLLDSDESLEACQTNRGAITDLQSPPKSLTQIEREYKITEEDELRRKKVGRRARMMDLGKKMGEKLEEKRRHIEERSRHIVEKMRGP